MTAALAAFLKARYDEAQENAERGYLSAPEDSSYEGWDKKTVAGLPPLVARQVLREVEAKRQLLEAVVSEGHAALRPGGSTEIYCGADYGTDDACDCGRDARVRRTLELLALPYSDHPEYEEALRP